MDSSMPGFPVPLHLLEFAHIHAHWISDAIQPSHPLLPSSSAFSLSQHQGLFHWVGSSHQVAKVLELQPHHQSFQWVFRVDILYDWLIWSPYYPRGYQESSPAPQLESINSLALCLLCVQLSHQHMTSRNTIALTIWIFVSKWCLCFLTYCLGLHSFPA